MWILPFTKGRETVNYKTITQLTFTCSESTIETLEKGMTYVQS